MKFFGWLLCFVLSAGFCQANPDTLQTASGLRYVVLQKGSGEAVKKGNKLLVHYTGRLQNGSMFDTSEGKKPLKVTAGIGQVIAGWDEMLLLMHAGEEVEVHIPAKLAYGVYGFPGANGGYLIPPNSDLFFRMKLVEVNP